MLLTPPRSTRTAPLCPDTTLFRSSGSTHADHAGGHDHGAMIADYRRRFWVTLVLTPPVLLLSPMIQHWLGLAETISFPGDGLLLFALRSEERRVGKGCFSTCRSGGSAYH